MPNPESHDNVTDIRVLNSQAAQELIEQSAETARAIVSFVYKASLFFLEKDRAELQRLEKEHELLGTSFEFYILDDFLALPTHEGEFQRALGIKLRSESGSIEGGDNELVTYVPIPDDLDYEINGIPKPDRIFIEHVGRLGEKIRYEVGEFGFTAYSALMDGQETSEMDILDSDIEATFMRKVDTGLPAMTATYQNLVNMEAIPQRRIIIGDEGVREL